MAEQDIREDQMTVVSSVDYVRGMKGKDSVLIIPSSLMTQRGILHKSLSLSPGEQYELPYGSTLAAKEEKDLGDLGYGMYLLASPNNAATAIFAFGSYSKGFVSDAGSNFYCDYTDGTKGVAFGRKTTNGSFFIKNNRSTETYIVLKRIGTL